MKRPKPNPFLARFGSAVFSVMALTASGAVAQGLPDGATTLNETHGDWRVVCTAPEDAVLCAIVQSQTAGDEGQRLLSVELGILEDGEAAEGVFVMPFGLRLADGITLAIDGTPLPTPLGFSTCLPIGCIAPVSFDDEAIAALRAGTTLTIGAVGNEGAQELAFPVSLMGMTAALNRVAELIPD